METSRDIINTVLGGYGESTWLKGAIKALLARDAVDAAHDAAVLAEIFALRAKEILGDKGGK